ncbi:M28 family peptidase, partial [Patescibacteria group bacterium]
MKKTKEFKSIEGIQMLTRLGTRQGVVAERARDYICDVFDRHGVSVLIEKFEVDIPTAQKARLVINGKKELCIGCGMISGDVPVTNIASSLMSSRFLIDTPVIYVNPKCALPSPTNFSFAPAIAISPKTAKKLLTAKNAQASLQVTKQKTSANFLLVGNRIDPKVIIFSHYDSLGPGAIDNASGTVVAIATALRCLKEGILDEALFVFDGNEEISYDYPTYWGHGYRVFEERYQKLLEGAQKVIVVDCVGNGK